MKQRTSLKATLLLSCISIALLLALVSTGFSPIQASNDAEDAWQTLSELVDQDELTAIVADNTAPSANRADIAENAVGLQKGDILVVDFASAGLCGRGGCAIAAYRISTGEQLLFTYAQRGNGGLVELIEREGVELPCLVVSPSIDRASSDRDVLCYRAGEWVTEDL